MLTLQRPSPVASSIGSFRQKGTCPTLLGAGSLHFSIGVVGPSTGRKGRKEGPTLREPNPMSEIEDQIEEIQETEGELIAREASKEAGTDSPFDGYGRPFSEDPLGMSDAYNHDNPANNVGPYSGPNSYSINTVTPYAPPHEDEENPGQNVGPYRPPTGETAPVEEVADRTSAVLKAAYKTWNDKQWFDGSSASIYDRAIEADQLAKQAHISREYNLADELREQIEILNKTAAEYDDSSLHEALENTPGGTVALEYDDLVDGGLVDVTSFLSTGAHKIAKETAEYDWEAFKTEGARRWVANKIAGSPGIIKHQVVARQAAIDYAKDKTMVLMDPNHRADIIDAFVTNAERFRRDAAKRLLEDTRAEEEHTRQIESAKMQEIIAEVSDSLDNVLPGSYTELGSDYDEDGYLDIGEDDGTPLYDAARQSIESSKRDWSGFTTDGAREWFFSKVIDSPMAKHDDITYRAAKHYATDQVAGVPDPALRTEVVRAFTESVEFLRQAHLHREAARKPDVESDIDEFLGDDQLWV